MKSVIHHRKAPTGCVEHPHASHTHTHTLPLTWKSLSEKGRWMSGLNKLVLMPCEHRLAKGQVATTS